MKSLCDINAFENGLGLELDPEVPPLPLSSTRTYAEVHEPDDVAPRCTWRARAAAKSSARRGCSRPRLDNTHLAFCASGVAADAPPPRHRHEACSPRTSSSPARNDRTSLMLGADAVPSDAADAFAASLGAIGRDCGPRQPVGSGRRARRSGRDWISAAGPPAARPTSTTSSGCRRRLPRGVARRHDRHVGRACERRPHGRHARRRAPHTTPEQLRRRQRPYRARSDESGGRSSPVTARRANRSATPKCSCRSKTRCTVPRRDRRPQKTTAATPSVAGSRRPCSNACSAERPNRPNYPHVQR